MILAGHVRTDFANINQYGSACMDAWPDMNDEYDQDSCMRINFASLCYHNYARYMSAWKNNAARSNLLNRTPITATLEENITVTTTWLDTQDVYVQSQEAGRIGK
jgi:hypothetical protein